MTRAKGKAQAAAIAASTSTKAAKSKATRLRNKIAAAALEQARYEMFSALTEEQQNAVVEKIDEAFRDYNSTMDAASDTAYKTLRDALKTIAAADGASIIRYALDHDSMLEYLYPFPPPSLEDEQIYLGMEREAEARAEVLAPTGTIDQGGCWHWGSSREM